MKNKKLFLLISPLISFMAVSSFLGISYTVANFIDYYNTDTTKPSFIDSTTENFICYPLQSTNNQNICSIGWAKNIEDSEGTLTIPQTVTKEVENETVIYQVKAIAECGFRFCNFSSITFAGNNIEEIKAEAFYSCQNITSFTMPEKCIHGVGPSSFMDCRNLATIDMSGVASYIEAHRNDEDFFEDNPYIIGDHAFTSCIKLKKFDFPANLAEIGDSAFMNCKEISGLYLPVNNGVNEIAIRKYAFSDCAKFTIMYFESNVTNIEKYAFAQCDNLRIYYNGYAADLDAAFEGGTIYRKKHVATNLDDEIADYVPIRETQSQITMDDNHLGFVYFKQNVPIKYNGTANGVSNKVLESPSQEYVTIFKWETPSESTADYNATTKVVTIPETIDGSPVKVISEQAFTNDTNLEGVVFNSELVQICKQAFKGCKKLKTIDFSSCTHLHEIGHEAFYGNGNNDSYTSVINIPSCMWYIGNSAFRNFRKAIGVDFNYNTANLKLIGSYAFSYLGVNAASQYKGALDLILPKSMSDGAVYEVQPSGNFNKQNWCVGMNAFEHCPLIKYVTMQDLGGVNPTQNKGWQANDNPRIGFGRYCFANCENLLRFKATKKMLRLGAGMFEGCSKLKEIFLSRYLYNKEDDIFIWSTYDNGSNGGGESQSIFYVCGSGNSPDGSCEFRDVVIYVDGEDAPVRRSRQQKYYVWNSDPRTYSNEYLRSNDDKVYAPTTDGNTRREDVIGRSVVPTYFNADWTISGTIKYVNLTTGALSDNPTDDYSNCAALLKKNNKYIVTKCYGSGLSCIDMTTWNVGNTPIDMIGSSSFGTLSNDALPSEKIILPANVTTIRDRAFYSCGTNGIDIVTYKDNGVEVTDTGATPKTNVCFLPSTVTKVEELAFFNNDFQKVTLSSGMNMMGNSAFLVASNDTVSISEFDGSGSVFSYIDDAMYDTATKTLLYSAPNKNQALDLSSVSINGDNIVAIGARALANTKYTSVTLPTTVSTIYGGAFNKSTSITQITGVAGLKYIAAAPESGDDVWTTSANYSVYDMAPKDFSTSYEFSTTEYNNLGSVFQGNMANRHYFYRWLDNFGAFANCTSMTTFDLSSCATATGIKKIGFGAFEGCSNLETMTDGSTTYTYYRYSDYDGLTYENASTLFADPDAIKEVITKGVVDLSQATQLTTLGRGAFRNCSKLKYFHLPMVSGRDSGRTTDSQAKFYLGIDYDDIGSWYSSGPKIGDNYSIFHGTRAQTDGAVLIGETAQYTYSEGNKIFTNQTMKIQDSLHLWDTVGYNANRYPSQYLKDTNVYYLVRSRDDYDNDRMSNIAIDKNPCKFWIEYTENGATHSYILFNSAAELKAYYKK